MRRLAILALAPVLLGQAAAEKKPAAADPCAARPQLYIAAMGEPFRAAAGAPDPMALWFAQADANRDGAIDAAEFAADAARFFAKLDRNRDGEIDPQEVIAYESEIAPEIRLYQRGQPAAAAGKKRGRAIDAAAAAYRAAPGAGRYAQLAIPEPVVSADQDFNRGISAEEFRTAAARRFALLGGGAPLTLAGLAKTPAQALQAACAAQAEKGGRR